MTTKGDPVINLRRGSGVMWAGLAVIAVGLLFSLYHWGVPLIGFGDHAAVQCATANNPADFIELQSVQGNAAAQEYLRQAHARGLGEPAWVWGVGLGVNLVVALALFWLVLRVLFEGTILAAGPVLRFLGALAFSLLACVATWCVFLELMYVEAGFQAFVAWVLTEGFSCAAGAARPGVFSVPHVVAASITSLVVTSLGCFALWAFSASSAQGEISKPDASSRTV